MRGEAEIDAYPGAVPFGKTYYNAFRPFSQGGFAIFSVFANSFNLLCKLHYVNYGNKEVPGVPQNAPVKLNLVFRAASRPKYWPNPCGFSDYKDYSL